MPKSIFIALFISFTIRLAAQTPRIIDIDRANDHVAELVAQFEERVAKAAYDEAIHDAQRFLEDRLQERLGGAGGVETWPVIPAPGETGLFYESSYLITRRLASAPPALRRRYAEILAERARLDHEKRRAFGPLAALDTQRRFPLTDQGLAALEEAAHAALESGRCQLAARLFGDLLDLDWRAEGSLREARLAALELAASRETRPRVDEGDDRATPIRIAAQERRLDDWMRALASERERPAVTRSEESRPKSWEELWLRPLPGWEIDNAEPLLPQPRIWTDLVIHHDRGGVEALRLDDGSLVWKRDFDSPEIDPAFAEMDDPDQVSLGSALSGDRYLFVNAHLGSSRKPRRHLVAISAADGSEVWRFDPDTLEGELEDLYLDCDPRASEGRVYLTAWDRSTTPRCHLLILAAEDGQLLSVTRLPPGVPLGYENRDGRPTSGRHWFSALPPTIARGFVLVCDNLGQFAALDAESGEPRFLLKYDRRRNVETMLANAGTLPRGFDRNPILVCGDRVVVAPDDSDTLLALFLRPAADERRRSQNQLLQRAGSLRRDGLTRLIAFDGESVVAAGRDIGEDLDVIRRFQAFRSEARAASWSCPLDSGVLGQGFLDQKSVYLCTQKYVYGIDLSQGAVFGPLVSREADGAERLGNLIPVGDRILVASRRGMQAFRPVW